jgi:ribosomal protein S26
VLYEALSDTKKSTRSQEKDGRGSINFSERDESDIKLLLLSNKSFTASAKGDLKLCLDIAMEQVARRNLKYSSLYPSYSVGNLSRISYFCLEKLITETTIGIRKLNDYQNEMKKDALKDGLYLKLGRDLEFSDLGINSIWDVGWSGWICVEEEGNVLCDFSDYVLSFLIEEISLDLYTF